MTPHFLESSVIYYDLVSWLHRGCLKSLTWQVSSSLDMSWEPVTGRCKCSDLNLLFVCFAALCFCSASLTKILLLKFSLFLTRIIPQKEPLRLRLGCSSLIWERKALHVKASWSVAHSCLSVVTLCFYSSSQGPQIYQKICVTLKY